MQYNYFNHPNEKLPPYGSVPYFAYRKLSDNKKEILYSLDQLKSQIISCTELYNNIEVANEKMNWWLKEINNLKEAKNISSPQIKKLAEIFDTETLYKNLVDDISHSIDNSSATERDFNKHISKNFLGIETLKVLYLNNFKELDKDIIKQMNINNEIVRHIFCIPKHFYNHIILDDKITPSISKEEFKSICRSWLKQSKNLKTNKALKPLEKTNKIHLKMTNKYIKNIENPFKETLDFSPLNLLLYSI
ncbi:hypothetical protein LO80_04940 [Candidatus Francisella endociliophora]|uniref:Uncharacterized protein n=1 Tax=Candidatus Francisella endociliophora TaxID=653937 RepID=A0A097EP79_9GAMM|nr:hypothetical protein [Francisella sp. FSC1006]AIT09376.1 hypothetical protein LO80_04940 [Francisella sp. FSC1006]